MRSSSPTAFRLSAWTLVASSLLLLNACGRGGKVEEAPRPVLVTHPVASDHTAAPARANGCAKELRARRQPVRNPALRRLRGAR